MGGNYEVFHCGSDIQLTLSDAKVRSTGSPHSQKSTHITSVPTPSSSPSEVLQPWIQPITNSVVRQYFLFKTRHTVKIHVVQGSAVLYNRTIIRLHHTLDERYLKTQNFHDCSDSVKPFLIINNLAKVPILNKGKTTLLCLNIPVS